MHTTPSTTPTAARPAHLPQPERPGELRLGIPGFAFEDLFRPARLAELHARFMREVQESDPALHADWERYRGVGPGGLPALEESQLLVKMAPHVSRFVGRLFGVETELEALRTGFVGERAVLDFKRDFIQRRVLKKGAPARPTAADFPALDADARLFLELAFPQMQHERDPELALARAVNALRWPKQPVS